MDHTDRVTHRIDTAMSFSTIVPPRRFIAALLAFAMVLPAFASGRSADRSPRVRVGNDAFSSVGARLERVSFTPSSKLPGIVVRLHFDRRADSFELQRHDDEGRITLSMNGATSARGFACDRAPAPIESCSVSESAGMTTVHLSAAGRIVTADAYRDGSDRADILIYLHASEERPAAAAEGIPARNARFDLERTEIGSSSDPSIPPGSPTTTSPASTPESGPTSSAPVAFRQEGAMPAPIVSLPADEPTGNGRIVEAVLSEPAADADHIRAEAARLRIDTIVLDAGHGGKDPGTIGHNRLREKDVVLDVALRVGAYLKAAGLNVVYTRDDDTFIDLKDRGKMALDAGGKLFVSIHANSARNTSAKGTETFYLGANKTTAARDVIERENQVIDLEEDKGHYDQFNVAQLARLRLTQSANLRQSLDLATRIQEQYRERVGRLDRHVKEGNLYVLWSAGMPAILTEIGFISNPEEARFLSSENGKDYIASAIFRAIRDYIEEYETTLDLATRG